MKTFHAGVNLGGWISQYREFDHAHFRSFIVEGDIQRIAGWGMDHVRLPVDDPVLEDEDGNLREEGFAYIDQCLRWCERAGLGVVIDLHHAPGFSFTNTLRPEDEYKNTLFTDTVMQERFVNLWTFMAKRYQNAGVPLVYELMNELVLPDSKPWNDLAGKTIAAIREIDADGMILLGGNHFNSAWELNNLRLVDDPNVFYNFHFYEPHLFTHQKAYWEAFNRTFNHTQHYPAQEEGVGEFLAAHPEFYADMKDQVGLVMDRNLLIDQLEPAKTFIEQTGRSLYCGEFGVIDRAPTDDALRWHEDVIGLFEEMNIGRAVWTYKAMDFGLVDAQGNVISEELVKVVSGR